MSQNRAAVHFGSTWYDVPLRDWIRVLPVGAGGDLHPAERSGVLPNLRLCRGYPSAVERAEGEAVRDDSRFEIDPSLLGVLGTETSSRNNTSRALCRTTDRAGARTWTAHARAGDNGMIDRGRPGSCRLDPAWGTGG